MDETFQNHVEKKCCVFFSKIRFQYVSVHAHIFTILPINSLQNAICQIIFKYRLNNGLQLVCVVLLLRQ